MPFAAAGAAIAGGLASGAVSAIGSAIAGSGQSSDISAGQAQANAAIQAAQKTAETNSAPFINNGTAASNQTANLLGLNGNAAATTAMGTFQSSPGYQYTVDQGLRAVDSGAAQNGLLGSGAQIKAEETLGANLANQNYQTYINNLSGLATTGASANSSLNTLLGNTALGQASTDTSAAASQASIYGNAVGGVTNQLAGVVGAGVKSYLTPGNGGASNPFSGGGVAGSAADVGF